MSNLKQIKSLNLEEADGISFTINSEKPESKEWVFTTMCLHEHLEKPIETDLGYKYQVVLWSDDDDIEVFEAIIGDVPNYVNRMIEINHEGLIMKKCKKSEEIMNKVFRGKFSEALKAKKFKQEDFDLFGVA